MEDKGKDWRGGGDSNAPTVSTPTDAVSDNNGSSGNSVTNTPTIDKPREVTAPAETSGGGVAGKTGNTDSVGDDAWADDNWGGPPL